MQYLDAHDKVFNRLICKSKFEGAGASNNFKPNDIVRFGVGVQQLTKYIIIMHNSNVWISETGTRCHAVAGTTARCALYNECTNPNPATNLIPVNNLQ